jgi:cytochrome c oxidase cbb3-type subunit I/II
MAKINAMRTLGVPYPEGYELIANDDVKAQQMQIVESLRGDEIEADPNTELVALIAYLQRLGTDIAMADESQTAEKQ